MKPEPMRCSMTGQPIYDSSQGIFEDGEWISWDWINQHLQQQDMLDEYPLAHPDVVLSFEQIVDAAQRYYKQTGRYLQIWGELGELYAEIQYGLHRHHPNTEGSDGRIDNDWIEVKTISPEKADQKIMVKRSGNFNKLLIIKIDEYFNFESVLIDRKILKKSTAKYAHLTWKAAIKSV